jgi:BirA family transcriptional regulator, biotin operon repressor / biotin---[acetyl-CoA-carboxylase] ligase
VGFEHGGGGVVALSQALFEVIPETGSTNADLLSPIARNHPPIQGRWLVANRQIAGRGRQGRVWQDGQGNFMGSVGVCLNVSDPPAQTLALVAGIALHRAVSQYFDDQPNLQLKWPNDLLLDQAKLAGILLERNGDWVVVGIGVNLVSAPPLPDRQTVALSDIGLTVDRDAFAENLAQNFAATVNHWRTGGWPDALLAAWLTAAHPVGTALTLTEGSQAGLTAAFDGLERDGSLRLRRDDGSVFIVHAGEVQIAATPASTGQQG